MSDKVAEILIVDDKPANLRLLAQVLTEHGYQVRAMTSGARALESALATPPDLILLDMGLPDLDGQTVAGLLKASDTLSKIPLVVVTAWPQETAAAIAKAYGCDGYISKPVHAREFAAQIAGFLEKEKPAS